MRRPSVVFYIALFTLLYLFGLTLTFFCILGAAIAASVVFRKFVVEKQLISDPPANSAVVITGTSSGFGRLFTLDLVSRGVMVFACVRKAADGERLQKEAAAISASAADLLKPLILDVTNDEHVATAPKTVAAELERSGRKLFGLINNAGIQILDPIETIKLDALKKSFGVNVFGAVAVTQAFLPLLREFPKDGLKPIVVFVSSMAGLLSFPFMSAYSGTKHALEAIADGLRHEVAPQGIRVNLIEPGGFRTEIATAFGKKDKEQAQEKKERQDNNDGGLSATPAAALYEARYKAFLNKTKNLEKPGALPEPGPVKDLLRSILFSKWTPTRSLIGMDAQVGPLTFFVPDTILDLLFRVAM